MISEKWDLNLNIEKLILHLKENVFNKEITRQSNAFGGWSVLSYTGEYQDGWQRGHMLMKEGVSDEERARLREAFVNKISEFNRETEICTGYMKEVIDLLRQENLSPNRARIICLTAGMESIWHRDMPDERYGVRLHVPLITNDGCFFETRDEREHMPADGSAYFLYVNREHRVVNNGSTDRYHLVVDVIDRSGVTKYHRLSDFIKKQSLSVG